MQSDHIRWSTPFGRWLRDYRVSALVARLSAGGHPTTVRTVQHWVAGRSFPRPDAVEAMVELSGGRIHITDVYNHRRIVRLGEPPVTGASLSAQRSSRMEPLPGGPNSEHSR